MVTPDIMENKIKQLDAHPPQRKSQLEMFICHTGEMWLWQIICI